MSDEASPLGFKKLQALDAVRDARCYTKAEKLVLFVLISRSKNGTCYPSLDLLADDCGMSRAAVAETVSALLTKRDAPVPLMRAHRARRDGTGGRSSNLYRLGLPPPRAPNHPEVESSEETQPDDGLSPAGGRNSTAVESSGQTQPTEGVESRNEGGLSPKTGGVESTGWTGIREENTGSEYGKDLATDKPSQTCAPGFALEAPEQKAKKPGRKRPAKTSEPDPNVNVLRQHHRVEHQRIRGVEPVYTSSQHAAAGKAWKQLLSIRSVDAAKAIITRALTEGGDYYVDPPAILKAQNKFASGAPAANRRRGYQPQAVGSAMDELTERARRRGAAVVVETVGETVPGAAQ